MSDWLEFAKGNPLVVTNVGVLVVNVVLTVFSSLVSARLFIKRRTNERIFQTGACLFQQLLVANVDRYVSFAKESEDLFKNLVDSCLKHVARKEDPRQAVEEAIEKLDAQYDDFVSEIVIQSRVYREVIYNQLDSTVTTFYDKTTDLFSKLNSSTLNADKAHKARNEFDDGKNKYLASAVVIIRSAYPNVK